MRGVIILVLTAGLLVGWVVKAQESATTERQPGATAESQPNVSAPPQENKTDGPQQGTTVTAQAGVSLSGTVEDQVGGVIPGAKVTLTNKAGGEDRSTVADDGGSFSFSNVPPGKYSISGKAKGFEPAEVDITVGAEPLAAIKLKLGISLKEEVTITDNQTEQAISPNSNADAVNLNDDFLKTLPSQSEDILPILGNFLNPAAQGTEGLSVVVDGVEDTQLTVPTDAIKRVIINKNPYSVAFRRPGQGRVEVITKTGSRRRYDGTLAYHLRNSFFDARDTFTRRQGLHVPPLDRRLFSASFGGPVPFWKAATFFASGNHLVNNESVVSVSYLANGRPLIQHVPTFKGNTNLLLRFDLRPDKIHTLTGRYYYYHVTEKNRGIGAPFVLPEQGYPAQESGRRILFSDRAIFSANLLNELHVSFDQRDLRLGQRPDKPAFKVQGHFIGGPSQVDRSNKQTTVEVEDSVTYTHGYHTIRFGGGLRPKFIKSVDATNFVGMYTFQNIFDYEDKVPFQLDITQGDPAVAFSQYETYGFFEDEIKLRRWFSLTPGLRYDWQSSVKEYHNFGPRLSFAFAPGKQKTVLRGGAGIFYEHLPELATERRLLYDGAHTRELTIRGPSYPDPFRGGKVLPATKPNVWRISPNLTSPYMVIGSVSLERRLSARTQVSVEYQRIHGVHLFRTLNLNAKLPPRLIRRPYPNFDRISEVESTASLRSSSLKVMFQGRIGKWFRGMVQYTRSRTMDDTNGTFSYPADTYDLRPEWGPSNLDQKHRFNLVGTFDLPRGFRLGTILILGAGIPYDITTGYDDNGDGISNDRPPRGTRNTGLGPPFEQLDVRFSKLFRLPTFFSHKASKSERKLRNFEFDIDAFNAFNHPNTPVVVGALGSGAYGQATTTKISRTIQLGVKYTF